MKNLLVLLCLLPSYCLGQIDTLESLALDLLIFDKINSYRISKGVAPFEAFEDSLMRNFSYGLTRENSKKDRIAHSEDFLDYSNAECIYSMRITSYVDRTIHAIDHKNFEQLAEGAVDGWINSSSHERCISSPFYHIATVTSRITIDRKNREIYFVTSYHALSNLFDTRTGYTFNYELKP